MAKPKILLVEDESDIRRLYAIGLNQRGFEVKLAANGAEAVERIFVERPDLVLLDWMMPLMGGLEVMTRLGVDARTASIPIIVISGHPAPAVIDSRIHCWLTKPVSIDEVVVETDRAIRRPVAPAGEELTQSRERYGQVR